MFFIFAPYEAFIRLLLNIRVLGVDSQIQTLLQAHQTAAELTTVAVQTCVLLPL